MFERPPTTGRADFISFATASEKNSKEVYATPPLFPSYEGQGRRSITLARSGNGNDGSLRRHAEWMWPEIKDMLTAAQKLQGSR
jgi:hypothetical protein